METRINKILEIDHYKGSAKDVLVAYYPFAENLSEILEKDPVKKEMLELARNSDDIIAQYIYYQVVDGWAKEILDDLNQAKHNITYNAVIRGKHAGYDKDGIENIIKRNLRTNLDHAFEGATVLNNYKNIFFMQDLTEEQAKERGFVTFGKAQIISLEKKQSHPQIKRGNIKLRSPNTQQEKNIRGTRQKQKVRVRN